MAKRDYSDTGQRSQSDELFEDIFQLALTKDQKKKKGAKPVVPAGKKSIAAPEASPAKPRKVSPAPPLVRSAAKSPERKIEKKEVAAKRPRSGRKTRILIVLVLLAAVSAAAAFLLPHLKLPSFFQRTPVQSRVKKEIPAKPSHRPVVREAEKPSSQVVAKAPSPVPAPPESSAGETGKQPEIRPRAERQTRGASPAGDDATKGAVKEGPRETKVESGPPSRAQTYPYSVYLGSFKRQDAVQKAMAAYHEKGLFPYLVRMDLGEKGVWMRVFSGHFKSQEEADSFIGKNQVSEAETKHTRYAVLVGEFSSEQEAEARARVLKDAGCHPYVIGVNPSSLRIYSGAYYRMEDAEKELAWLASKGVKGRIVER